VRRKQSEFGNADAHNCRCTQPDLGICAKEETSSALGRAVPR
jgi:hypothetical protein